VRSVTDQTVTLDTAQGPRLFQIGPNVRVFRALEDGQEPASLEAVIPGQHLAVFGRIEGDGARQLIAARLVLLPPTLEREP
jgi:hypothetical protein